MPVLESHVNEITQNIVFHVWFLLLIFTSVRFTYVSLHTTIACFYFCGVLHIPQFICLFYCWWIFGLCSIGDTMHKVSLNILMPATYVLIPLSYITKSGITLSKDTSICHFSGYHQTVLQSNSAHLHSHHQCLRVPV